MIAIIKQLQASKVTFKSDNIIRQFGFITNAVNSKASGQVIKPPTDDDDSSTDSKPKRTRKAATGEKAPKEPKVSRAMPSGKVSLDDLPVRPKRPLNPYARFAKDNFPENMAGKQDFPDVLRKIGQQWQNLTDGEKETYKIPFYKDREAYKLEMDKYKKSMKQTVTLEQVSSLLRDAGKRKKNTTDDSRKISTTGYRLFIKEFATGINKKGILTETAAKWKSLGDDEKQKYNEEASKLNAQQNA